MTPHNSELLHDLTPAGGGSADALILALRRHRRRQTQRRAVAVIALSLTATAGLMRFQLREPAPSVTASESVRSPMLTQSELLDSFGDQPVALVTWPDGRQQLLAIAHRAGR